MTEKFFEHQTISSKIKALIVSDYFPKYCKILLKYPQEKIRYIDLFAGPGIYEDGSISTPILVANACYADSILRSTVELAFNDNVYCSKLKDNFEQNYPIGSFANEPHFGDKTIGEDPFINDFLCRQHPDKNPHPSLLFIAPIF